MGVPDGANSAPQEAGQASPLQGCMAGAASGLVSRFLSFPADTLKARLQVQGALAHTPKITPHPSTWRAAQSLYMREGVLGFYRGFGAVALGAVPAQSIYFMGYELGKRTVPPESGIVGDMATGCIAQLIAGVAFTPVDVIKERMQVQTLLRGSANYTSAASAAWSLVATSGPLGLFRGFWATNCVWLPWNILYISAYEDLKRRCRSTMKVEAGGPLPAHVTSVCALVAASGAAVLTHPPDVIKTRLQVLTSPRNEPLTFWSVGRELVAREGVRALWSGVGARVLTIGPGAALGWMIYEEIKTYLVK